MKESEIRKYTLDLCNNVGFIHHEWFWEEHLNEVVRLAKIFGKELNADMSVLLPSAYLHDIGKLLGMKDHANTGATESSKYLETLGFPKDKIEKIADCIREHSSGGSRSSSLESEILSSCDGASHFTTLFFERYLYDIGIGLYSKRKEDWNSSVRSNISKALEDWEKISVARIRDLVQADFDCFKRRYKLI